MCKNKRILALIPARGFSKGLPRKNIRPLSGKPLIAWTIGQALASKYCDRVIVSTEDEEIAEISKKYGAEIPFVRPKELAGDDTKGIEVVLNAIAQLKEQGQLCDIVALLQPTSPLRSTEDIDASIELLFQKKDAQIIVSVCQAEHHPYWSNTLPKNGCMKDFVKTDSIDKNRQKLPCFYRLNGAVYVGYCEHIEKQGGFWGEKTFAYIMPKERSVDIDSIIDFKLAELLMSESLIPK